MEFCTPLAVFTPSDGGEWLIRDGSGQRGRFCVIDTYTVDVRSSHRTLAAAKEYVERFAGPGKWSYRGRTERAR